MFKDGDWWIGQYLEHDIASQARTLEALEAEMARILAAHVFVSQAEGLPPFANLPEAPREFWEMFEHAKPVEDQPTADLPGVSVSLPPTELRLAA